MKARGFTLVEVMISVALVLVLIFGINAAFKTVVDTVGAGQALSSIVRDGRALQPVINNDVRLMVKENTPFFFIASSRVSAYRNRTDELSDRGVAGTNGPILTVDLDNNNEEGESTVVGEIIQPAAVNYRSHRTDRFAFFARGLFPRQTGNGTAEIVSSMTTAEAWVWYGHLRLLNNSTVAAGNFKYPGEGTTADNPNNYHAANFSLGRFVLLLKEKVRAESDPADDPPTRMYDNGDVNTRVPQAFIDNVQTGTDGVPLSPFAYHSPATAGGPGTAPTPGFDIETSRYDLGAGTIPSAYNDVRTASGVPHNIPPIPTTDADWWQRLLYIPNDLAANTYDPITTASGPKPRLLDYRFYASRFFAKPLDAAEAARIAPILATGCTQFIVEFAGDYVSQEGNPDLANYGAITGGVPDGITDFVIDAAAGRVRVTRWYGMPRDVAGTAKGGADGQIPVGTAAAPPVDVVPLRDVRLLAPAGTQPPPAVPPVQDPPLPSGGQPFERVVAAELPRPATGDYLAPGGMAENARYTCVWGPDVSPTYNPLPRMVRVTYVLDEANGRLADGQTYEHVIQLP